MHDLLIALITLPLATSPDRLVIDEGFEAAVPDFHTYRATYAADRERSHTGAASLRVTPKDAPRGGAYFKLDGMIDLDRDYEFSAWVYSANDGGISLYISAAGEKGRFTVGRTGGGRKGKWVRLMGQVRRSDWRRTERQIMLAMVTTGVSWFDDVVLRETTLPDPPIQSWPSLEARLRSVADERVTRLAPDVSVTLDAKRAALAPDTKRAEVVVPDEPHAAIAEDSVLMFAVDATETMHVTGTLTLTHGDDLRPGLRAYVLCDSTLVAAPMVNASPWQSVGRSMTGPAPDIQGTQPPDDAELVTWCLPKGRHYVCIAGPHFRPAGLFRGLSLRGTARQPPAPRYQFALFSDTHVGSGRSTWMNVKLAGPVAAELTRTFSRSGMRASPSR